MMNRKTNLLILSILLCAGSLTLLFYQGKGEAFSPNRAKMRVLRGKNQTQLRLTEREKAAFRRHFGSGARQDPSPPRQVDRLLDDQIPKHVPIKIKIRKEKEKDFKDPDNEHWIRSFELEVKNTGAKPIYFLSLVFGLPEVKAPDGNEYGFSMNYGRSELARMSTPLKPEDVPIRPGETHVFTIPVNTMQGWEDFSQDEMSGKPHPKKVQIRFNVINFGDGTGLLGPTAAPIHKRAPQRPVPVACREIHRF